MAELDTIQPKQMPSNSSRATYVNDGDAKLGERLDGIEARLARLEVKEEHLATKEGLDSLAGERKSAVDNFHTYWFFMGIGLGIALTLAVVEVGLMVRMLFFGG